MMRNTKKNRQTIAKYVDEKWGTLLGDVLVTFLDMSETLKSWSKEYVDQDKIQRHELLHGQDDLAEHAKRRKAQLVERGY